MNESVINKTIDKSFLNKPHEKYRNIIFDLGRVLINWDPESFIDSIFGDNKQKAMFILGLLNTKEWADWDRGILDQSEILAILSSDEAKKHWEYFIGQIPKYLVPIPEGVDLFNQVCDKGYNVYLLSNYSKSFYEQTAATYDFLKRVNGAVISYQVNRVKPEPEIYQILLSRFGLKAEESLFIDDREENIQAGKALNIDGIVCSNHDVVKLHLKNIGIL